MVNCTLTQVIKELRNNEMYINGNIALYKNSKGIVKGKVIKCK